MTPYRIVVVGGWCGNRMAIVADHVDGLLRRAGHHCRIQHHSIWENPAPPPAASLVLQLLPAFSEAETGCPVISIRPLLRDLDHAPTIEQVLRQVRADHEPVVAPPLPPAQRRERGLSPAAR